MSPQTLVGIVLVVVGVVVLIVGMNAPHSVPTKVSQTFTGRSTQATTWYIGGVALALLGALLLLVGVRGSQF